ncbi:MAG: radical SAM protein [Phycisphaerae bacterium]|jgi:wyosine [tRNA(Phe)-imidazoG37] synthetase (radical SAM superfamily)
MALGRIFGTHGRKWRQFRYVYPVISRRARGLSIGVNINPDGVCNYDCVYCQVDRAALSPTGPVDLAVVEQELRHVLTARDQLFNEPEFAHVPPNYRRLNDIAFSGDGEPTASPVFPEAARLAARLREECRAPEAKIVVITNACFLTRPAVADTLAFLDDHNGEIWAKLDAGTEAYQQRINRSRHTLTHVLENIQTVARARPIVIQSLFLRLDGEPPAPTEIAAYVDHLRAIVAAGGKISLVQIYTVARKPAVDTVTPLTADELEAIATDVRNLGLRAECYA